MIPISSKYFSPVFHTVHRGVNCELISVLRVLSGTYVVGLVCAVGAQMGVK